MAGFEPTTSRLLSGCSTAKLHWRVDCIVAAAAILEVGTLNKAERKKVAESGFEPPTFEL